MALFNILLLDEVFLLNFNRQTRISTLEGFNKRTKTKKMMKSKPVIS